MTYDTAHAFSEFSFQQMVQRRPLFEEKGVFGLEGGIILELPHSPLLTRSDTFGDERKKLGGFAPPPPLLLRPGHFSEGKRDGFSELEQDGLFSKIFLF